MKINQNQISNFLQTVPYNIKAVLFYGNDSGVVSERSKYLQKAMQKAEPNIAITKIAYDEIKNNEISLSDLTKNFNFFSDKQIFIIDSLPNKVSNELIQILDNTSEGNFFILLAGELLPSSNLRNVFEKKENFAALACYKDDEKTIRKIAENILRKADKTFDKQVLDKLEHCLKGNRRNIYNELEKLITYSFDKDIITIDDVNALMSSTIDLTIEDFVFSVADKNLNIAVANFNKLIEKNYTPIFILRCLSNYFARLYFIKLKQLQSLNLREAIKELSPPIFVMHINRFLAHVENFKLEDFKLILELFANVEHQNKINSLLVKQNSEKLITDIVFIKKAL